jgi:hypothetical protein
MDKLRDSNLIQSGLSGRWVGGDFSLVLFFLSLCFPCRHVIIHAACHLAHPPTNEAVRGRTQVTRPECPRLDLSGVSRLNPNKERLATKCPSPLADQDGSNRKPHENSNPAHQEARARGGTKIKPGELNINFFYFQTACSCSCRLQRRRQVGKCPLGFPAKITSTPVVGHNRPNNTRKLSLSAVCELV